VIRSNRLLFGFLIALGSIVGGALFLFGIDRATNGGEVLGDVTVNGVELGGLGEFEALERGGRQSFQPRPGDGRL
jgi:hypothetical protein